ncbi:wax ester/triacylglycerol synthase domain-containing protein [Rhodococcus ruber]|uniref:wax ester/triacylglycerol synthase domain-containing protein n=1 Tax=Rhodococcus ruber TaxID=1830 RepID=UPI00345BA744
MSRPPSRVSDGIPPCPVCGHLVRRRDATPGGRIRAVAAGRGGELFPVVESIRRRPLDRSRPLWELWVIPGLGEHSHAVYLRVHHVIADGPAGVAMLGVLLDAAPDVPLTPAPPRHEEKIDDVLLSVFAGGLARTAVSPGRTGRRRRAAGGRPRLTARAAVGAGPRKPARSDDRSASGGQHQPRCGRVLVRGAVHDHRRRRQCRVSRSGRGGSRDGGGAASAPRRTPERMCRGVG